MTDFVRNRLLDHRDDDEVLLRLLDGFANRFGYLAGLPDGEANPTLAVADDDERAKAEALSALDDFRHAIDAHDRLIESRVVAFATGIAIVHQKFNPASRAASANACTRPWYLYPPRSNTTSEMPAAFAFAA